MTFSRGLLSFRFGLARSINTSCRSTTNSLMIFGTSSDVGKSIVSAGLCKVALTQSKKVYYLKPMQTGELDEYFIQLYTNPRGTYDIALKTLYHRFPGRSPEAAAFSKPSEGITSDQDLINSIVGEITSFALRRNEILNINASMGKPLFCVVETNGGVLSPVLSKTLQADLYLSLNLPIVLVGDSKYGGITTTLSAYEALLLRGYNVRAICMIDLPDPSKYGNVDIVRDYVQKLRSSRLFDKFPPVELTPEVIRFSALPEKKLLHDWFDSNHASFQKLYDIVI